MDQETPSNIKPVAYDVDGKPLYATPEEAVKVASGERGAGAAHAVNPMHPTYMPAQFLHSAKKADPDNPMDVPIDVQQKHEESVKRFPDLNLSPNEFIITSVPRHFMGLLGPAIITTICIALVLSLMFNFPYLADLTGISTGASSVLMLAGVMLVALFLIGGYAVLWVFLNNRFFLTNESVIQEIQTGLFSHKEQTVSLANIEDASYSQVGPIQTIFNYGSIRLSTEGDETTYRFNYVANPKYYIAILNNAVEAFKNGRPVGASVDAGLKKMSEQGKSFEPNDD